MPYQGKETFSSTMKVNCSVEKCSIAEVADFIASHYLQKRPAIVLLCLRMLLFGKPVGCVVYSAPPRECDRRFGCKTWELARLFLLDEMPHNSETWLIAQSIRWVKRHFPDIGALVSYADPAAGHTGTIYRASNWKHDGMTDAGRKTPRCDYVDAATGKKYGRRGNVPQGADLRRIPRQSKHRFVYLLK